MQLYVEGEITRRRCAPPLHHSRFRHGIKRRVHLDQFEMLRVPTEPLACRHLFRIPTLDKTGVRPARSADTNLSAHTSTKSQRRRKQTRLHFPDKFQANKRFLICAASTSNLFSTRGVEQPGSSSGS